MTDGNDTTSPNITLTTPVFGIRSYDDAVAYYVDWLGFNLDWEVRSPATSPVIMRVSRDGLALCLNEHPSVACGFGILLETTDLDALAAEWNSRRPGSVEVYLQPPYEIPCVELTDPFGNEMHFQGVLPDEEWAAREKRQVRMRAYIRQRLADGHACPTPDEVVEAIGRPVGLAMAALSKFPEYEGAPGED
jgi:hypothetical protein